MTRLERALGRAMFLSLVETAGGLRLPIPSPTDVEPSRMCRARLRQLVGLAVANTLEQHFAGERIYVPKGPHASANASTRAISPALVARLTRQGKNSRQIAQKLGCTQRAVHRKRAQARKANLKLEQANGKRPDQTTVAAE